MQLLNNVAFMAMLSALSITASPIEGALNPRLTIPPSQSSPLKLMLALLESVAAPLSRRGPDPFSGVTTQGFPKKACVGSGQGIANINAGTTDCINLSNAESYTIRFDECQGAHLEKHHATDCKGDVYDKGTLTGSEQSTHCYDFNGEKLGSYKVIPFNCPL